MDESRWVSQFTVNHKATPTTVNTHAKQNKYNSSSLKPQSCTFCAEHLNTVTQLRKRQILLELEIQQLKSNMHHLQQQNNQLKEHHINTYEEYQRRLESQNHNYWNREDIEAELFEAKVIIELLLGSKSNHPQIKTLTDQNLKQKYSDLLLQNWRLKQKVEARDRLIQDKQYYPIYHQHKRISTLQKAAQFWYKKSNEDCLRMKTKVNQLRVRLEEDKNQLRDEVRKEMQRWRTQFGKEMQAINHKPEKEAKHLQPAQKKKNTSNSISSNVQRKKANCGALKTCQLKKFR